MIDIEEMKKYKRVALAVSGGKDSMALLNEFIVKDDVSHFYVINVEHGIRGEESLSDSEFVREYARKHGIQCKCFNVDAPLFSKEHGYTLEQGARILRHDIFKREILDGNADRVLLAHHADDNVESVLLHLFRGAGLRGITGMEYDNGYVLRPLIGVSREEIDRYVELNGVPYREDSTNNDTAYMRNFVRKELLPLIRSRFNDVDSSILRLARNAGEDERYLSSEAQRYVNMDDTGTVVIDCSCDNVLFKRALYMGFLMLGVSKDIEERHYLAAVELKEARNGTGINMPYGIVARKEYGVISLTRVSEEECHDVYPLEEGEYELGEYIVEIKTVSLEEVAFTKGNELFRELFVDKSKLTGAVIRTRREKDTFRKYKGGNKKLKDYMIDIKLPRRMRNIPIIARDNEVLVIVGKEISNDVVIDDNTSEIYKITLRRKAK